MDAQSDRDYERLTTADPADTAALLDGERILEPGANRDLHARWEQIQASFVDEPRQAVREADELVAFAIRRIAEVFSEERANLERQWDPAGDVSTEELRQSLKRYRSLFQRLLSI